MKKLRHKVIKWQIHIVNKLNIWNSKQDLPSAKAHVYFIVSMKYPSHFELSVFICFTDPEIPSTWHIVGTQ